MGKLEALYYRKGQELLIQVGFEYAQTITCHENGEWGSCCPQSTTYWVGAGHKQIEKDEAEEMLEITGYEI